MKVQKQQPTAQATSSDIDNSDQKKYQPIKKETTVKLDQATNKLLNTPKVIHCGGKVYRIHPAADIFIEMDQLTLSDLAANMKIAGQYETIKTKGGLVVDGRGRLIAANDAGIEPRFEELDIPDEKIADVVVSLNKHRKHLTASQLAMAAARCATYKKGDNQHTAKGVSQTKAAAAMNVSIDGVQRALRVHMNGVPELNAAVDKGLVDVTNAAVIATLPPQQQAEIVAQGANAIQEAAKVIKISKIKATKQKANEKKKQMIEALLAKNKPLPVGRGKKYGVIYADVPWNHLGALGTVYPTMSDEEIAEMPVMDMAEDNAVLFFWATASTLPNALTIIEAWGFDFKTSAVWTKGESGMGSYFRTNHEVLMLATRGKPAMVANGNQPPSSFYEDRREHSRKPEKAYEMIQTMYPGLSKLELFCRGKARDGWDGWGNECEGAIEFTETALPDDKLVAANDHKIVDIGDELLAAIGQPIKRPAPNHLKPAA